MSEDLSRFKGERREELRGVGLRNGSDKVQSVGQGVVNALRDHGATLADYGYVARAGTRLEARLKQSVELTTERPDIAREKTATRDQAAVAHKEAKQLHKRLHTVVGAALDDVRDDVPAEQWRAYKLTLDQTRSVGASPQVLGRHMASLAGVAQAPELVEALKERGAADAAAQLTSGAASMRADVDAAQLERGTKAESEEIDVLDGLIIEDLRSIRRFARSAAAALGRPQLAEAFDLSELR